MLPLVASMRFLFPTVLLVAIVAAIVAYGDGGEGTEDIDVFLAEMSRARAAVERPGQVLHVRSTRLVEPSPAVTYIDQGWVDIAAGQSRVEVVAGEGPYRSMTICHARRCWTHQPRGRVWERSGERGHDVLLHVMGYFALADRGFLERTLDPIPEPIFDEETGLEFRSVGGSTRVQRGQWDGEAALVLEVDTIYAVDGSRGHKTLGLYVDPKSYLPLGWMETEGSWGQESRRRSNFELIEFIDRDSLPADFFDPMFDATSPATPTP